MSTNKKKIFFISTLILLFMSGTAGMVFARGSYAGLIPSAYGDANPDLLSCNLCHQGPSWVTGYASDWSGNGGNARAFSAIENMDSDRDGIDNIVEINAGTYPGDPGSFPDINPPPPSNTPPVADAGSDQTVASGARVTLDGSNSYDDDGDPLNYSWTQTGGNNVVLSDSSSDRPTFTAPDVSSDIYLTFELVVSDGTDTDTGVCVIMVERQYRAPVASIVSSHDVADSGVVVTLNGSNSYDPDGDIPLSYGWSQTGGDNVELSGTSDAVASFIAPEVFGSSMAIHFRLTVTDSTNMTDTADYIVNVSQTNRAPMADAGPNQTVEGGTDVTLSGQGSDPDGDTIYFNWEQTGGIEVFLSDSSSSSPSFTAPDADASLQFTLTVSDSDGLMASDICTVNVNAANQPAPNTAPIADAGEDQFILSGDPVVLDGTNSSDPDGDAITFSWTQTGGPAVTLTDQATESPSFTAPEISGSTVELVFTLTVDDGSFQSTDSVKVYVEPVDVMPVNNPPVADAGMDISAAPGDSIYLDGTDSYDPDGDNLFYHWSQTQGTSMALLYADTPAARFEVPFDITENAVLVFELTVTDDMDPGLSNSDTVEVSITVPVVDPPDTPGPALDDPVAILERSLSDPSLKRGASRSIERVKMSLMNGLELISNGNLQDGIQQLEYAMDGIQRSMRWMPGSVAPMLNDVQAAIQTLIGNAVNSTNNDNDGYPGDDDEYDDDYRYHDIEVYDREEYGYQRLSGRDSDRYDD